jgi:hypothetical protein
MTGMTYISITDGDKQRYMEIDRWRRSDNRSKDPHSVTTNSNSMFRYQIGQTGLHVLGSYHDRCRSSQHIPRQADLSHLIPSRWTKITLKTLYVASYDQERLADVIGTLLVPTDCEISS